MEIISNLPKELINFVLVVIFSLLIGLEQRRLHIGLESDILFGTDRTITLIGILGFILYSIMPQSMMLFIGGGVIVAALLGVYYYNKIKINNKWGFTSIVIALITYCLTPLVASQPLWMVLLIVVTILIVVELKEDLMRFSQKFDRNEFSFLAKFIIIAGIVLPLLPHTPISSFINISPYQIWISIVAVSGISYLSYLLRKFVFPDSGILLSAILGGLYSSTATTLILSRKSKEENNPVHIAAGILGATGMMYIRLLMLAFIFNPEVGIGLLPYFIVLILINIGYVGYLLFVNRKNKEQHSHVQTTKNPLEFKTALVFGLLFAIFSVVTGFVIANYGNIGVNILSFIVGVTDIDPYILSLFQDRSHNIDVASVVNATVIATASNNLIKMIYSIILGHSLIRKPIIIGFSIFVAVSFALILIF